MQWVRIIDRAADFSFAQKFLERIARLDSNGVLVVDVFETFRCERRHDARNLREEPVVFRGVVLAGALPIRKMTQLYAQNTRLDFLDPAHPPPCASHIFLS